MHLFAPYTHEDEHTIAAVDLQIRHTLRVGLSVYIDAKDLAFLKPYTIYNEGGFIAIIDQELQRR